MCDTICDLVVSILELLNCNSVILFCLLVVKLKLFAFSILLSLLVCFPILNSFLVPLFHETSISLQFVDLNPAHLLLARCLHFFFLVLILDRLLCLPFLFVIELLHVNLHI